MKHITILSLLKETAIQWNNDKVSRMAAAVAYYTIFSLAPIMIICISIVGVIFGHDIAQNQLLQQIHDLIGAQSAQQIHSLLNEVNKPNKNLFATILGGIILIIASIGLLTELQDGMNTIWNVTPKPGNVVWRLVKYRILSFTMVLATGFLLLVSLIFNIFLAAFGKYINAFITDGFIFTWVINIIVSIGGVTCLFALIFKILPDIDIRWRDVWLGAFITALLFTFGKNAIAAYIGNSNLGSIYGASSSFIIILVWVYYSSQILFIGAEFTKVYIKHSKHNMPPPRGYATSLNKNITP